MFLETGHDFVIIYIAVSVFKVFNNAPLSFFLG